MLKRALLLRDGIDLFQKRYKPSDGDPYCTREDAITEQDWIDVKDFIEVLKPFMKESTRLQGNASYQDGDKGAYGALWQVFTSMTKMTDHLERMEQQFKDRGIPEDSYLREGIKMGIQKMAEYWDKLSTETPYYTAATILHPSLKFAWFEDKWRGYPGWAKRAGDRMKSFFKEYADAAIEREVERDAVTDLSPQARRRRKKPYSRHSSSGSSSSDDYLQVNEDYSTTVRARKKARIETELTSYYKEGKIMDDDYPGEPLINPLAYWIRLSKSPINPYPTLTRMALDLFAVPAMSAECQRVFSQSKHIVTDERNRITAPVIEALQCQKNWLRNEVVKGYP